MKARRHVDIPQEAFLVAVLKVASSSDTNSSLFFFISFQLLVCIFYFVSFP